MAVILVTDNTPMETLNEWLAHCDRLHPKTIDLGLDRVRAVLQRMHLRFDCPVITVAGTNGKGSTCAMLEAICLQAGWRTGVFTSPHLVHFEERCRIAGEIVKEADLLPQFARVEAQVHALHDGLDAFQAHVDRLRVQPFAVRQPLLQGFHGPYCP